MLVSYYYKQTTNWLTYLSVNTKHMAQKYNSNVAFPKDTDYILRCTEESFSPSKSSGNPMITLKFEVVSPEEKEIAGEVYNIAGVQVVNYYTTQVMSDGVVDIEKTKNSFERIFVAPAGKKSLYDLFGLDGAAQNPENPALAFKGKLVYALMYDDVSEQRKSPTKEQLAKGQKQGDILVNPVTKQPLLRHQPKVGEIFGLAPADSNKPY